MDEEERKIELTRDDVLVITLLRATATWLEAEPQDVSEWINSLLPVQEQNGDVLFQSLRHVDIECQCLLRGMAQRCEETKHNIDNVTGTILMTILTTLRDSAFGAASRAQGVKTGETIYWSIRRYKEVAWWVNYEPSKQEKMSDIMKTILF